ncbi:MAG: fibronectin type III domain-containing protein [Bacteroidetes bacterium]|nr:fibronectin type III domain-containing protein [Bacteroidota bacterium]
MKTPQIFPKRLLFTGLMFCFFLLQNSESKAACNIPAGLTTTNITSTGAKLNWASTVADSFLVRYYVSGSITYLYKTVKPGTVITTTLAGLYPNTTYYWQIRSWCSNGTSGAYQTTPATFTTMNQSVNCVTPNLTATGTITANTAAISWNPMVTADSFQVRYNVKNTTNYVWLKYAGSVHNTTITNLLPNTQYVWSVRCICASVPAQAYSPALTFTTLSTSCGTADVYYFSSSSITSNGATVGWRAVSGATSYNIRYAVRYSGNWITVSSTTVSKALSALGSSTWYEFQVQSVCASGAGSWSASGIFLTLSGTLSITRGAYLQLSTPSSIYIRWRTNNASDTKVKYGTSASNLNLAVSNSVQTTEHILQLTGLAANTKYYYSVGSTTTTLQGDTGNYFVTNPAVGSTGPVRIWAFGDFGVASNAQAQVRDAYRNYTGATHTNVWLWLGDNAYNDGTDTEYQTKVFNMYPSQFKKFVVWPTSGNHDLHTANATNQTGPYFDNFTMPKNGEAGGLASGTEAYYSFNYANIHFICLESYDAAFRATGGAMATWLTNDLNANTQRWTVVYFHHPPYSKGSHNSDTETELIQMRTNIMPILEGKKVDLVMAGHSHSYERSMLIRGHFGLETTFSASTMAVSSGSGIYPSSYIKSAPNYYGTVYLVCGVGGQVGASTSGYPHNAMYASSISTYGSMVIDVQGDRMDTKFLTSTGGIWDQFTIQKTGTPSPTLRSEMIDQNVPIADPMSVFPNPVRDYLTIDYNLNKASRVQIDVLDLSGRLVYEVADEMEQPEGRNQIYFPVRDANLPKGIYIIRLMTDEGTQSRRVVID